MNNKKAKQYARKNLQDIRKKEADAYKVQLYIDRYGTNNYQMKGGERI